jgi:predicted ATPase
MSGTAAPLVIITGGPGTGKTTLIDALGTAGYPVARDGARAIIQYRNVIGGPWHDPDLFGELMLSWDVRTYHWALEQTGPVFFDNGVPSDVGYWRLLGRPVPAHLTEAVRAYRYHPVVFVAPPWPEIYRTDTERTQTFAHSERVYGYVRRTFPDLGYQLIDLPRCDPAERARFVLDQLGLDRIRAGRIGADQPEG